MAAIVNQLENGHPHEPGDCAIVALAVYLQVPYTEILRRASVRDSAKGRRGLWPTTMQKIAADFGRTLTRAKLTEDSYGVIVVPGHAAVVRAGLVLDRLTVWDVDDWLSNQKMAPSDAFVLVEAE